MAVLVVDLFEVIEVEEDHPAIHAVGDRCVDDFGEPAVEIAVVVEVGQVVPLGQLPGALGVDGVHQRQRDRLREDTEQ